MNKSSTGIKVGVFFVIGLIVLVVMIEMLSGKTSFGHGYKIFANFQNAHQISIGAPVRMGGVEIGKVQAITLDPDQSDLPVKMELRIRKDIAVHTDSEASIMLSNLFGESFIDLSFGKASSPRLESGTSIHTKDRPDFNLLLDKMDDVANNVKNLTRQLADANPLGPIADFLTDFKKDIQPKLSTLLNNAASISDGIVKGEGTVGKLVKDPGLYDEAKTTLDSFEKTSKDLAEIGANLKEITANLRDGKGTAGKFLKEDDFYTQADEAIKTVNEILKKVNEGKGSIGELLNDPTLIRNAKVALQKLDKATDSIEDQGPLSVISILISGIGI